MFDFSEKRYRNTYLLKKKTPGESPPQKLKKNVLGHVAYQSKAHEKLYSNMSIKYSFDPLFDHQQLRMTGISFF